MQFGGRRPKVHFPAVALMLLVAVSWAGAQSSGGQSSYGPDHRPDQKPDHEQNLPGNLAQAPPDRPCARPSAGSTKFPDSLPSRPAVHRFWDRDNVLLFAGVGITRGMDYASTRNFQARGRDEILIPDDVVNNSPGFASLEAAATATSIGISYVMHRTGHHKLERWLSIGHIGVTGFGDVRNYCLKTKHAQ
jgi:hypothetical protein